MDRGTIGQSRVSRSHPSIGWPAELLKGIKVKAEIVTEDEFEHSTRKYLNFGHTFGHAVEAVCGFGGLSHGECVMIGMAYSLILSEKHGAVDGELTKRFIDFAEGHGYTFQPVHDHSFDVFLTYMEKDKKVSFGKLNFVLLDGIGSAVVQRCGTGESARRARRTDRESRGAVDVDRRAHRVGDPSRATRPRTRVRRLAVRAKSGASVRFGPQRLGGRRPAALETVVRGLGRAELLVGQHADRRLRLFLDLCLAAALPHQPA